MGASGETQRQTASPGTLIRTAVGGPRQIAAKLRRLARTARLWFDLREIDRRLTSLEAKGFSGRIPASHGGRKRNHQDRCRD